MFRLRRSKSRFIRSAAALLTLFSFVIAAVPIPLPVMPISLTAVGGEEPFPCQGSRCGCHSAKQCWTACCCRKPSERKRWAEEQQVRPPAYAILHDGSASAAQEQPVAPAGRSCCAAAVASANTPASSPLESCRAQNASASVGESSDEPASVDYVLTIRALECRGMGHDLSSIAWFHWSPAAAIAHDRDFETLAQRHYSDRVDSCSIDPATPPPRFG